MNERKKANPTASPTAGPGQVKKLQATVRQLEETVRIMEEERERVGRQRARNLLMLGVALSLVAHITLMILLATLQRSGGGGTSSEPVGFEFAILEEEELTDLPDSDFEDVSSDSVIDLEDMLTPSADLQPNTPAVALEVSATGSVPTLGGSGAGASGDPGLSGGTAGTSFFGISSRGTRFAYIVDKSGSMGQSRKMYTAVRELRRSIEALPDYAYFYVVLFSSDSLVPPMQRGWKQARRSQVRNLGRWLEDVSPSGGTQPKTSFQHVMSLDVRPDVIFFLTDGQITSMSAEFVAAMNGHGKRVVINTVSFGDDSSQDLLKRIAADSGGVWRHVPSE